MSSMNKKTTPGAKKGENRFKAYQEGRKRIKVRLIEEALRRAKSLRLKFKSFSQLSEFIVSEIKMANGGEGGDRLTLSQSSLYRTPEYRILLNEYMKLSTGMFEGVSKAEEDLNNYKLSIKVKVLETENARLKLFIEKNLSTEPSGFSASSPSESNETGDMGCGMPDSPRYGDMNLSGELDAVGKLCVLVESMVLKSELFYEIKDGVVVTSAYGVENEIVGSLDIQSPFTDWFVCRYCSVT